MHDHVEVRALFRDRWKRSKDQWDKRTLADGPLDVAHNQAVLVVQELHADLGDLRPECICQASLARCKLQKWTNLATRAGAPNDLHDDGELSGLILRRSTERECWSFCSLCTKPPGRNSAYHDVVDNEEGGREGGACISPSCGCVRRRGFLVDLVQAAPHRSLSWPGVAVNGIRCIIYYSYCYCTALLLLTTWLYYGAKMEWMEAGEVIGCQAHNALG